MFQGSDVQGHSIVKQVEKHVADTYLNIADEAPVVDSVETKEQAARLRNCKMYKGKLVTYLKKRYTGRLVQKLASIFDWSNGNMPHEVFYQRVQDILIKPKELPAGDSAGHLRILKRFAFQMFDMNCDN